MHTLQKNILENLLTLMDNCDKLCQINYFKRLIYG